MKEVLIPKGATETLSKNVAFKSLTFILLIAFALLISQSLILEAQAGWWSCLKATAKCVAATGAATAACTAAAGAPANVWLWTVCAIKTIDAAEACDKATAECGL